jgi:hypothetical protein
MIRVGRTRAPFVAVVAAIFTATMFYASVCSAMCAVGVCPNELQDSTGGNSAHAPMGRPDCSQHRAHEDHDCSTHHHPVEKIVKTGHRLQVQLAAASRLAANHARINAALSSCFRRSAVSLSGLAPPPALFSPLDQQPAVLRV